jgi:hypothetical protein
MQAKHVCYNEIKMKKPSAVNLRTLLKQFYANEKSPPTIRRGRLLLIQCENYLEVLIPAIASFT